MAIETRAMRIARLARVAQVAQGPRIAEEEAAHGDAHNDNVEQVEEEEEEGNFIGVNFRTMFCLALTMIVYLIFQLMRQDDCERLPKGRQGKKGLFIFGDSTVYCGESASLTRLLETDKRFPCNGSNPKLVPELLAQKMGLKGYQNRNISFQEGIILNFGSARATIKDTLGYYPLKVQLHQGIDAIRMLKLKSREDLIQGILFYFSIGKDDYMDLFSIENSVNLFAVDSSERFLKFSPEEIAKILVAEIEDIVRELYSVKVRKILWMGLAPLGCSPKILYEFQGFRYRSNWDTKCITEVNNFIVVFNQMLSEKLSELRLEFSQLTLIYCNVYEGMMTILANPNRYGFRKLDEPCCGDGRVGCMSEEFVCEDTDAFFWWDQYDPSEAVNRLPLDSILANNATALGHICSSSSIEQAFYA